jgi:hypothetical protein
MYEALIARLREQAIAEAAYYKPSTGEMINPEQRIEWLAADALERIQKMQPEAWTTQQNLDELRSGVRSSLSGWHEQSAEDGYVVPLYRFPIGDKE